MKKFLLCLLTALIVICVITEIGAGDIIYKDKMRELVRSISTYAKAIDSDFVIIPQNGLELVTTDANNDGPAHQAYCNAIDGVGQEDLFYGYDADNTATSTEDTNYLIGFLNIAEASGVEVLVTDYCSTQTYVDDSYAKNFSRGYISFAADQRDLDNIPAYPAHPFNENTNDITSLAEARNFLYLIDPGAQYSSKTEFINAVAATNYDIVLIDLFFDGTIELTAADVTALKTKANGHNRLVIAYLSIGEAEDYRFYWDGSWTTNPPSWLSDENPDWPGNYKVEYWNTEWQAIMFGNTSSYMYKILNAGFDGAYLDIIDAFEYFE